ncbi:hypothetical protein QFZ51_004923 [Chitinophaga sp. W3I9]
MPAPNINIAIKIMRLQITPFAIISIIALIATIYYLQGIQNIPKGRYGGYIVLLTGFLFVITLVLDVIFRLTIKSLLTIWIVEAVLAFIGLVVLLV